MHLDYTHFDNELQPIVKIFNAYYNYFYLYSMHNLIDNNDIDTIITGISYGLNGVDTTSLKWPSVNLSMHSQDLYYDYLHIKKAINNNPNKIKRCVITLGYYSLHYDLSRALYKGNCLHLYYPLFKDLHNVDAALLGNRLNTMPPKIIHEFALNYFETYPTYYGPAISYEDTMPEIGTMYGSWKDMPQEEKEKSSKEIALRHNKHKQHLLTFDENKKILNDMLHLLQQHSIIPIVLILPYSKEYLKYIDPEYKTIILNYLEELPYNVHFLDMNEYDFFEPNDFLNTNHLNARGAQKMSNILNNLF